MSWGATNFFCMFEVVEVVRRKVVLEQSCWAWRDLWLLEPLPLLVTPPPSLVKSQVKMLPPLGKCHPLWLVTPPPHGCHPPSDLSPPPPHGLRQQSTLAFVAKSWGRTVVQNESIGAHFKAELCIVFFSKHYFFRSSIEICERFVCVASLLQSIGQLDVFVCSEFMIHQTRNATRDFWECLSLVCATFFGCASFSEKWFEEENWILFPTKFLVGKWRGKAFVHKFVQLFAVSFNFIPKCGLIVEKLERLLFSAQKKKKKKEEEEKPMDSVMCGCGVCCHISQNLLIRGIHGYDAYNPYTGRGSWKRISGEAYGQQWSV